jgi:glycosyltransferase involved in cell wall biosynthesis
LSPGSLYVCYLDVGEPLVETQVIAYIRGLSRAGYRMHLLTFERHRLAPNEKRAIEERLAREGITWHRLRYHQEPTVPATAYDTVVGGLYAAWLVVRHRLAIVHGRSHVGAAMGLLAQGLLGRKLLFDVRGLLAEEYVGAGHWRQDSLAARITSAVQTLLYRRADGLVVLTHRLREELLASPTKLREGALIEVIPCCVAEGLFELSLEDRALYRGELGVEGRRVLLYTGKLGVRYRTEDVAGFVAAARRVDPKVFFCGLTQSDPSELAHALNQVGLVDGPDYFIGRATPDDMGRYLVSADAGLALLKGITAERASSPTKVGEYLAAGLPVVTSRGIGDLDTLLDRSGCAVLLGAGAVPALEQGVVDLFALMGDPGVRDRCREMARRNFSLEDIGVPRYRGVYERLIGRPETGGAAT